MTDRPDYAPDSRTPPPRALADPAPKRRVLFGSSRFTLENMRVRLTFHFVLLSAGILTIIGLIMTLVGISEIRAVQDTQSREVVRSVDAFVRDMQKQADEGTPVSTYDVLYGYLAKAPHSAESTLIGAIDGRATIYQTSPDSAVVSDTTIMASIQSSIESIHSANAWSLEADGTTYRVTVVPISVVRDSPGAVVMITDSSEIWAAIANLLRVFVGLSLTILALVAVLAWLSMSRILKPLVRLRKMARTVAATEDLSQRIPVNSDDDLGELATSVNDMVGRLQTSFEAQRHLLNDAGHELRTPLTIIRGHLEVMNPADSEDAGHTRALVLDEVSRMQRLTEDLIEVARADSPSFVRPQPMNITELTLDVAEHASHLGTQRIVLDHLAEGEMLGDPQRLSQALLQLAENSTKFSAPDAAIAIGSQIGGVPRLRRADGHAVRAATALAPGTTRPPAPYVALWVRDVGIGIEERNLRRIFDRFARVDHARPGSGLGLTIVSAIAAAHHGALEVMSAPGVGSIFTLYLPFNPISGVKED